MKSCGSGHSRLLCQISCKESLSSMLISLMLPLLSQQAACVHTAVPHPPRSFGVWRQESQASRPSTANCTWYTYHQKIDHFGSTPGSFSQRYCLFDKWWRAAPQSGFAASGVSPGPIFFYAGNESPVAYLSSGQPFTALGK